MIEQFRATESPPNIELEKPHQRIDWQRARDIVITMVGVILLALALALVAQKLSKILLIVLVAALVAYVAAPLVSRLEARMPRGLATLLVFAIFFMIVIAGLVWLGKQLIPQVSALVQTAPADLEKAQGWLKGLEDRIGQPGLLSGQLESAQQQASKADAGSGVLVGLGLLTKIGDAFTNILLTLVIGLYFVLDADRIRRAVAGLVPADQHYKLEFIETTLHRIVGGYIRGQLLMALIIGTTTGIGMFFLGVRFPLVIGVAAFLFELIPMVGPILAGALAIAIAAFQGFPLVLYVVVFYVVLQLVESNVLGPRISGHAVGLHPAASILALVTGAELFGLWGAIFAVPVAGLLFVISAAIYHQHRGEPVEGLVKPRRPWRRFYKQPLQRTAVA